MASRWQSGVAGKAHVGSGSYVEAHVNFRKATVFRSSSLLPLPFFFVACVVVDAVEGSERDSPGAWCCGGG